MVVPDCVHCLQELYRWPKVAEAARYALGIRYSLLPYLYSSFRNTASHGCPLARALMLGWPWDPLATGVDRQWTMGDAVLVTPVMEEVSAASVHQCSCADLWYGVEAHLSFIKQQKPAGDMTYNMSAMRRVQAGC